MESIERLTERLDNLQAVVPMLEALRLVALGSWQASKKRGAGVAQYATELGQIQPYLADHLPPPPDPTHQPRPHICLLIGSERGLVGRFLEPLAERAVELSAANEQLELIVLGSRLTRVLERHALSAAHSEPLSSTGLPSWELATRLADGWWQRFQAGEIDRVLLIHQATRGVQPAKPITTQLLPLSAAEIGVAEPPWPPPILETDPATLAAEMIRLQLRATTFAALLRAAEAEHMTRFQLLEAAVQNADRLREDLITQRQNAQQQAITREMQELIVGAGMLGEQ